MNGNEKPRGILDVMRADAAQLWRHMLAWAILAIIVAVPLLVIAGISRLPEEPLLFTLGLLAGVLIGGVAAAALRTQLKLSSLSRFLVSLMNPSEWRSGHV